jgi:hypothetical protein
MSTGFLNGYEKKTVVWQTEGGAIHRIEYMVSKEGGYFFNTNIEKMDINRQLSLPVVKHSSHGTVKLPHSRSESSSRDNPRVLSTMFCGQLQDLLLEDVSEGPDIQDTDFASMRRLKEKIVSHVNQSEFTDGFSFRHAHDVAAMVAEWATDKFPFYLDCLRRGQKPRFPTNPRDVLRTDGVSQYKEYATRLSREPYIVKLRVRDGRLVVEAAAFHREGGEKTIRRVLQLSLDGEIKTFVYCRVLKRESWEATVEEYLADIVHEISMSTFFQFSNVRALTEHSVFLKERRDSKGRIKGFEMPFYIEGSARTLIEESPFEIQQMESSDSSSFRRSARSLIVEPPRGDLRYSSLKLFQNLQVVRGVLRFADALHRFGFIHNDLKPDNVLVRSEGRKISPVVIDYGTVRKIGARPAAGTPAYRAPEYFVIFSQENSLVANPALDNYAIGIMMSELVYGQPLQVLVPESFLDHLNENDQIDSVILGLRHRDRQKRMTAGIALKRVDEILQDLETR